MPRSSDPHILLRDPDPTRKPWMVGRMPSVTGGRALDFSFGYTPDGEVREETTDRGAVRDQDDNFFYLCVFGGTLGLSQSDMHECVEEMVYTRQEKAKRREPNIATAQQLKEKVADLIDAVNDAKVGRKRF